MRPVVFGFVVALLALVAVTGGALRVVAAEDQPAPARPKAKAADLAWLAGTWRAGDESGGFEEHWTAPWGGTLAAVSREVGDGGTRMVELSSIEPDGEGLVLRLRHFDASLKIAAMDKDGALSWPLAQLGEKRAVFDEPTREFPRRIVYEREGDTLRATLEGARDGKPQRMAFELSLVK